MKRAVFALACVALLACTKDKPPPPPAADASAPSALTPNAFDGETVVKNGCLSCHAEDMLAQQRLTLAQWTKVVTKMEGWGANIEPGDVAPLARWLAERHGPDAGAWEPPPIPASAAAAELAHTEDGPFANGDVARGKALYVEKCSGCHGADARGHIGVTLVDRPILWRAQDVANVVRRGRGKMTPIALSDGQIGDVLAHLRSLENPLP